jgi:predicted small secreted protein
MKTLRALAVLAAAGTLAGCPGIPNDDRYQTHDGGRSNTRAQAPGEPQKQSRALVALFAALASLLVAGCPGIPNDGRYQTHGGGWDNFRAEAAIIQSS